MLLQTQIPTYDLQKNADPSKCNRFCPGSTGALWKEHFPSLKTLKIGDLGLFFLGYEKKVVWTIDSEIFSSQILLSHAVIPEVRRF